MLEAGGGRLPMYNGTRPTARPLSYTIDLNGVLLLFLSRRTRLVMAALDSNGLAPTYNGTRCVYLGLAPVVPLREPAADRPGSLYASVVAKASLYISLCLSLSVSMYVL